MSIQNLYIIDLKIFLFLFLFLISAFRFDYISDSVGNIKLLLFFIMVMLSESNRAHLSSCSDTRHLLEACLLQTSIIVFNIISIAC